MVNEPTLEVGDRVEVMEGAFTSMQGDVLEVSENYAKIELTIIGRAIEAEFTWDQLAKNGEPLLYPRPPTAPPPPDMPSLVQAVLDDPWDDDARGVYADWLEDHDDPHQEYLRVQVSLAEALREGRAFDNLVHREQELRRQLDPEWVAKLRRLTTEPASVDVGSLVPALAERVRVCVRLHPRPGTVKELDASKLGGLFLWPEEEPWPTIQDFRYSQWYKEHLDSAPWAREDAPPEGAEVPLAPVIQLRAKDIPNLEFPPGKDLLQLFWCPLWSEMNGPVPFLFWQNSKEVVRPHISPPQMTFAEKDLVPGQYRLHCEQVVEYPLLSGFPRDDAHPNHQVWMEALAQALDRSTNEVEEDYIQRWSVVRSGSKVGGYPYGHQWGVLTGCGGDDELECLLSLSMREFSSNYSRWCPLEDRDLLDPSRRWQNRLDLKDVFPDFGRGDYFVLLDRRTEPWSVSSYYDYTG